MENELNQELFLIADMISDETDIEEFRRLLALGASPNAGEEKYGISAMEQVARYGNVEILKLFIEYGGIVDETIIEQGHESHEEEMIKFVENYPKLEKIDLGVTQLMYIASLGIAPLIEEHLAKIRYHPRKLALLNQQDLQGFTALHYATLGKNPKVIRALIEAGANLDIIDENGNTARDYILQDRRLSEALF